MPELDAFTRAYIEAAFWSSTVTGPNVNCLANLRCPECLSFGPFSIAVTRLVEFDDNGERFAKDDGDNEWDDNSVCICKECNHEATIKAFTMTEDEPLDRHYSITDLAPETVTKIVEDCAKFQADAVHWINSKFCTTEAGHDFWLTRNGHGAGFLDGDWDEPAATALTGAAKSFGEFILYVGNDGRIYS